MILSTLNIPIQNLPVCYAKKMLLRMVKDPTCKINVVATQGGAQDWSCYIGFPMSITDIKDDMVDPAMRYYVAEVSSPEGVASNGDKLDKDTAEKLFPMLKHLRYRA